MKRTNPELYAGVIKHHMAPIRITPSTCSSHSLPGFPARNAVLYQLQLEGGIHSMQGTRPITCTLSRPRPTTFCTPAAARPLSTESGPGSKQLVVISFRIESERHLLGEFLAELFPSQLKVLELRSRFEISRPRVVLRNRMEKV
jgi:hypothetical protein